MWYDKIPYWLEEFHPLSNYGKSKNEDFYRQLDSYLPRDLPIDYSKRNVPKFMRKDTSDLLEFLYGTGIAQEKTDNMDIGLIKGRDVGKIYAAVKFYPRTNGGKNFTIPAKVVCNGIEAEVFLASFSWVCTSENSFSKLIVPPTVQFLDNVETDEIIGGEGIRYLRNFNTWKKNIFYPPKTTVLFPATKIAAAAEVQLPNSIVLLGGMNFMDSGRLDSVVLPRKLKHITRFLFKGSRIKEVTIPREVDGLDISCFESCNQLTSVTFAGDKVETIGNNAFAGCGIKEIHLPDSVKTIGAKAFYDCPLEKITFPDTIEDIGRRAFESTEITEFDFPSKMTEIHDQTFAKCAKLREIHLPWCLKKLGEKCFAESGLEEIELPDGVLEIGNAAFANCKKLRRVILPGSLVQLGIGVFEGCPENLVIEYVGEKKPDFLNRSALGGDFRVKINGEEQNLPEETEPVDYFTYESKMASNGKVFAIVTGYRGLETKIEIPAFAKLYGSLLPVKRIGAGAFAKNHKIESVTIPNGVLAIEQRAFEGCTKLTHIDIPDSVSTIGTKAFNRCRLLRYVHLGPKISTIRLSTFKGCETLQILHLEDVKAISPYAFSGCSRLQEVYFSDKIKEIGDRAFHGSNPIAYDLPPHAMQWKNMFKKLEKAEKLI